MMGYNAYDAWLSVNKLASDPKAYYRETLQDIINDRFEESSDYRLIDMLDRDTLLPTQIGVRLTKTRSINKGNKIKDDYFKILFKDLSVAVEIGDLFEFDNFRWLVLDIKSLESGVMTCTIQRCNVQLKFVESNNDVLPVITDTIYTIDCIAENRIYDDEKDQYYTIPNNNIQAKVPNNSVSRKINFANQGGTRFILGNPEQVYATTSIDSISMVRNEIGESDNGVLLVKLKMERINPRQDNIVEKVAKQRCYGGA